MKGEGDHPKGANSKVMTGPSVTRAREKGESGSICAVLAMPLCPRLRMCALHPLLWRAAHSHFNCFLQNMEEVQMG
jgi:hypothetical protein